MKHLTSFVNWIFLVGDDIANVSGPGIDNEGAFDALHQEAITFIKQSLRLPTADYMVTFNKLWKSVQEVREAMTAKYTEAKWFYN